MTPNTDHICLFQLPKMSFKFFLIFNKSKLLPRSYWHIPLFFLKIDTVWHLLLADTFWCIRFGQNHANVTFFRGDDSFRFGLNWPGITFPASLEGSQWQNIHQNMWSKTSYYCLPISSSGICVRVGMLCFFHHNSVKMASSSGKLKFLNVSPRVQAG